MSSIRRVKKGVGRRPQSAKRRRFMELRGRGWGISAAAGEVGVSRTAANNPAFGDKVYRKGQVVGAVTPVDRLAVREISVRYLSQNERIKIADMPTSDTVTEVAKHFTDARSVLSQKRLNLSRPIKGLFGERFAHQASHI